MNTRPTSNTWSCRSFRLQIFSRDVERDGARNQEGDVCRVEHFAERRDQPVQVEGDAVAIEGGAGERPAGGLPVHRSARARPRVRAREAAPEGLGGGVGRLVCERLAQRLLRAQEHERRAAQVTDARDARLSHRTPAPHERGSLLRGHTQLRPQSKTHELRRTLAQIQEGIQYLVLLCIHPILNCNDTLLLLILTSC